MLSNVKHDLEETKKPLLCGLFSFAFNSVGILYFLNGKPKYSRKAFAVTLFF